MGFAQDVRDAYRALNGSRRTSLTVILTLSLALGLNAALFSVINSELLRPLPYPSSERLVAIGARWPALRIDRTLLSAHHVAALRRASAFEDIAAGTEIRQNLTGRGLAQQVVVGWVSDNLLSLLGAAPEAGRLFAAGEPPGRAILSHQQAVGVFGRAVAAVGAVIQLDAHPYEIIGVLEQGFRLHAPNMPQTIDVWKVPDPWWQNGRIWDPSVAESQAIFTVIGRLREGVSLERARAELAAVASQVRRDSPEAAKRGLEFTGDSLLGRIVGDVRGPLLLLWGAVGVLIAIACANVTNLLLVRAEARRRDLAVRVALGASRWRLFRLVVGESAMLAVAGAAAATALAFAAIRVIRGMDGLALTRLEEVQLDWKVFAVSAAVTLGCTLLMGLAPFVTVLRTPFVGAAGASRTVTASQRLTRMLVVAQIALSLVLLVAAGLLTTSLVRLASTNPGFDADRLLTFSVSLPGKKYTWPEGADRFHHELGTAFARSPA